MTTAAGARAEKALYRPYGEEVAQSFDLVTAPESAVPNATGPREAPHGFIGERFDAEAGLMYLNARYYDPRLGLFVQPDWWEVTRPGVGTNRYSYAFEDPVNGKDPSGHACDAMGACGLPGEYIPGFDDWSPADHPWQTAAMAGALLFGVGVAAEVPAAVLTGAVLDLQAAADGMPGMVGARVGSTPLSFAQKNFREKFSGIGAQEWSRLTGREIRTIDDLAGAIRSGAVSSSSITLETVKRNGVEYILNTRTAMALERSGVKKKDWKLVDKTGDVDAERRLTDQLSRNGMDAGDVVSEPSSRGGSARQSQKPARGLGSLIRDLVNSVFGG